MRTITTNVYQFDELSEKAKEKAREWYRQADFFITDWTIEDAVQIAEILGIIFDTNKQGVCVYWSGFCSQGDGASFDGSYRYAKGATKAIRQHAPQDTELHRIADKLLSAQRARFYKLRATCKARGHYFHSVCMGVGVMQDGGYADDAHERAITEALREFADWIYKQLQREYEFQSSDEQVDEAIRANEYEFTENGERVKS